MFEGVQCQATLDWIARMAREHPIPWLMGHLREPLVTQSGLLHLAGPKLTPVTLQNWANREHLAPYLGENPNKKTRRRYDGLQVVNVCLSLEMTQHGISPMVAMMKVMMAFVALMRDLVLPGKDPVKTSEPRKGSKMRPLGPGDIPLEDVESYVAIFRLDGSVPFIRHERDLAAEAPAGPMIVLPIGRQLTDLGQRL